MTQHEDSSGNHYYYLIDSNFYWFFIVLYFIFYHFSVWKLFSLHAYFYKYFLNVFFFFLFLWCGVSRPSSLVHSRSLFLWLSFSTYGSSDLCVKNKMWNVLLLKVHNYRLFVKLNCVYSFWFRVLWKKSQAYFSQSSGKYWVYSVNTHRCKWVNQKWIFVIPDANLTFLEPCLSL